MKQETLKRMAKNIKKQNQLQKNCNIIKTQSKN